MIYSAVIWLLDFSLRSLALFIPGIRKWNKERTNHLAAIHSLPSAFAGGKKVVWFHCASLGEFEQARPVIESLFKEENVFVALSFFSPSGYEIRKQYPFAHLIFYLPLDKKKEMKILVDKLQPKIFVGVKYDFWWHLFDILNAHNIPKFLIALKMDDNKYFFKAYGKKYLRILKINSHFYCQDLDTEMVLRAHLTDILSVQTVGDPRVDSVLGRAVQKDNVSALTKLLKPEKKVIIYGSVYRQCMTIIEPFINQFPKDFIHVIVPHDVSPTNIQEVTKNIQSEWVFLNELKESSDITIIMVNEVGKLFDLYSVSDICYIGGGFTKNLHNTLEPARFGLPIAIGPKHHGFNEVDLFIKSGVITEVKNSDDFIEFIKKQTDAHIESIKTKTREFFQNQSNASLKIVDGLKKELTTSSTQ